MKRMNANINGKNCSMKNEVERSTWKFEKQSCRMILMFVFASQRFWNFFIALILKITDSKKSLGLNMMKTNKKKFVFKIIKIQHCLKFDLRI